MRGGAFGQFCSSPSSCRPKIGDGGSARRWPSRGGGGQGGGESERGPRGFYPPPRLGPGRSEEGWRRWRAAASSGAWYGGAVGRGEGARGGGQLVVVVGVARDLFIGRDKAGGGGRGGGGRRARGRALMAAGPTVVLEVTLDGGA